MSSLRRTLAAAALSLATLAPAGYASAADLAVKALKPVAEVPFFLVIDNRVSFSWMPKGTDPGMFTVNPNGSINGTTAKQVYSFTHFDAWAYGTNFFTISMFKSGHNDPASPCVAPGVTITGGAANCAGATEIYGLFRSTFGFNEIFNTKAFTMGPLRNVSFEVGMDANTENNFLAPAKRDVVAGLQFAFDLPYKGYVNVAPLMYWEFSNHNAFTQCGLFRSRHSRHHLQLGRQRLVPADMGGRGQLLHGPRLPAAHTAVLLDQRPRRLVWTEGRFNGLPALSGPGRFSTASKTEFNSEPIRLTFDASKAFMGPKYSHFVDLWVAYRYWQNKFGLDHNAMAGVCTLAANGQSTNSCTEFDRLWRRDREVLTA